MGRVQGFFSATGVLLLLQLGVVIAQNSSTWLTLSGNAPAIVAKGGFSGLFPDSSSDAYNFVPLTSSSDTILWCDVQLTKDGVGVCIPNVKLDNCTNIAYFYQTGQSDYLVNGVNTTGWFSVDYTMNDLSNVSLIQAIYSRSDAFDSNNYGILAVEDVARNFNPPGLWLNIQHDIFYAQHNLSMTTYVLDVSRRVPVDYVSSPELAFLSRIAPMLSRSNTKLIFRFLDQSISEPSTDQTYGSLLNNLTFIKTFASGILVPKSFIWPVTADNYMLPYSSLVLDAHRAGLEIYAADFANDHTLSYNYSYDPLAEYLAFIDNGVFSVDGVVTDFPVTPSEARDCFSHLNISSINHGTPLIISHNGGSGDYPDCTDLAYQKAVDGGVNFIDCPIQVTQDGIAICMSSIDLVADTTVTNSPFANRFSSIPEVQDTQGIFTFNLTWDEIQMNLQPKISSPELRYYLVRNPRYANAGTFMRLSDFLSFAKGKPISGILINIEHAAFMVEQLGYGVIDAVISALQVAGYDNQTALQVMIMSTNSSVLIEFQEKTNYTLVYQVDESIRGADSSTLADIKKFADAVAIDRQSVYPESAQFITKPTDIVPMFQAAGLAVYVYVFRNEFVAQPWDFFSDATVEINSYVEGVRVDGIITDFPATAARYKRNSCRNMGTNAPSFMSPVQGGALLQLVAPQGMPPALAPMPVLNDSDVVEPPLPPVSPRHAPAPSAVTASPPTQPSSALQLMASIFTSLATILSAAILA
ncbi:glycerophosphodiester phosphodiesterase GDPDL4-like [Zingiber officinale]|uniref:glycerophosphodiester phosphodiesterase GDPDL4-like n=1 Tax=Zingiber officinale TaxID=94328 RepID=UPI001C4CDAA7|nr:glycerophosphodiester phosphodiesterase GDPDL4-like [Zingiber officinale]